MQEILRYVDNTRLYAPKGKDSNVRMDRPLFDNHCDVQRILHEAGEIIL